MLSYLVVALGGALGSVTRFWVSGFVARRIGESFPWDTLLVNVSGSFVIGFFATLTGPAGRWLVSPTFRQFFMIGACGGYTTFSAFSLQTLTLFEEGEWFRAGSNTALSVLLCLLGVWLGALLASTLASMRGH